MTTRTIREIEKFFDITLEEPAYKTNQHMHYVDENLKKTYRIPKALITEFCRFERPTEKKPVEFCEWKMRKNIVSKFPVGCIRIGVYVIPEDRICPFCDKPIKIKEWRYV